MTIFKTAYDTTPCRGFVLNKTINDLQREMLKAKLQPVPGYPILREVTPGDQIIEAFSHPILIPNPGMGFDEVNEFLCYDVRAYTKLDMAQNQVIVRNKIEYDLVKNRAKLNSIWVEGKETQLRDISPLPLAVFCSWISEQIQKRFFLDPKGMEQLQIAILSGIFYNSLFHNKKVTEELDEYEKMRVVQSVSKATRAKAEIVLEIIDEYPIIPDIATFCHFVKKATGNVRLEKLDPGLLYAIVGRSFVSHLKEMVCCAIEHPPTWLAIIMATIVERTYGNSPIAEVVKRQSGKDNGTAYLHPILRLLGDI